MEGMDGFAPGIPACSEGGKPCVVTCGLVGGPPFFQLLIPSLTVCCSADTDMSSPYGGMSSGVHRDLLLACCHLLWCAVRSTNRLIDNIGCGYQTVQRIDIMEIMNYSHDEPGSASGRWFEGDMGAKKPHARVRWGETGDGDAMGYALRWCTLQTLVGRRSRHPAGVRRRSQCRAASRSM
jgi:hypothetical protein